MNLTRFVTGWRSVCVEAEESAAFLELCRRAGLPYEEFDATPEGGIRVSVRSLPARRLRKLCEAYDVPIRMEELRGLPALALRMRERCGVVVGLLLGVILLVLSSQVVWDVRVSGNERLSAHDVKASLAACGFTVGTSFRGFAADVIENRTLMYDKRLAWISINRRGNVAYVQVREATYAPEQTRTTPANLVAARAGTVERVELIRGNLLVAAGQRVDEGQLLVSGLYDSTQVGFRWTHAEGRVYARTVREFLIEIPLSCEQTEVGALSSDDIKRLPKEKTLIFFGKSIKFSKKTGNEGVVCDTIEGEKNLSLLPGIGFPISVRTTWYLPRTRTTGTVTRTPAEAEELAYMELARRIAGIPGGAELLEKTILPSLTDTCFRLQVTLVCVEDIAREVEFGIGD